MFGTNVYYERSRIGEYPCGSVEIEVNEELNFEIFGGDVVELDFQVMIICNYIYIYYFFVHVVIYLLYLLHISVLNLYVYISIIIIN